jgi:hypothetical protein
MVYIHMKDKLIAAIVENINSIMVNAKINKSFTESDFLEIVQILTPLLDKISIPKDKESDDYSKNKKNFNELLLCKTELLQFNDTISDDLVNVFGNELNENWNSLYVILISYYSTLKLEKEKSKYSCSYMIDRLMKRVEEFNVESSEDSDEDSDDEEADDVPDDIPDDMSNGNNSELIPSLLGDIKGLLNTEELTGSNIIELTKNLSNKYQTMIDNGDANIEELLSGVIGLLSDPNKIDKEFSDFDVSKIKNPDQIISDITNDPSIKDAMSMVDQTGLSSNAGMFGSILSNFMGGAGNGDDNGPQTMAELETEIEKLMNDVNENVNEK